MKKQSAKWGPFWFTTLLPIFLLVIELLIIATAIMRPFFYDDFWYNEAQSIYDSRSSGGSCYYPECSNQATHYLKVNDIIILGNDEKVMIKQLKNMPNKAGFAFVDGSFSYTEKDKHTYYDKGTYLVAQGNGNFKVENRTNKYEYYTDGKTTSNNKITFCGSYCDNHNNLAKETWRQEVEDALHTNNFFYWVGEYWLWALLGVLFIFVVWTVIAAIMFY